MFWTLRDDDGNRWIGGVPPIGAEALVSIPKALTSDDPEVRRRLMPEAYMDPEEQATWERFSVPELKNLFAGRLELVEDDLGTLRRLADVRREMLAGEESAEADPEGAAGHGGDPVEEGSGGGVPEDGVPEDGVLEGDDLAEAADTAGAATDPSGPGDLDGEQLEALFRRESWIFRIGKGRESAWLSTLNAARHALFLLHGLAEDDMERPLHEFPDPATRSAVLQIDFLGRLQMVLIEDV